MKEKILSFILAILLLLNVAPIGYASEVRALASSEESTQYAYSIGTDYSSLLNPNVDTSEDAEYASVAFSLAGYKSYVNTAPTASYMLGNSPNGNRRLESSIVFLSGHGNSQLVSFHYKNKGGDYKTGIIQGEDWVSSSTGYSYAGIDNCDLENTVLYVFAACQTASGTDNITLDAVTNGASCAIGWEKSVGATSHSAWLVRFCDELAAGSTVYRAKQYADSFTYSDDSVKTGIIAGDSSTVITDSSKSSSPLFYNDSRIIPLNNKIQVRWDALGDCIEAAFVDAEIPIVRSEFVEKQHENIIDLIYTIDGIETSSGYTIIIEDGFISQIYDNMGTSVSVCTSVERTPNLTTDELSDIEEKARINLSEYSILGQSSKYLFDIASNKYYVYVITDYQTNDDGSLGRSEFFYEI